MLFVMHLSLLQEEDYSQLTLLRIKIRFDPVAEREREEEMQETKNRD